MRRSICYCEPKVAFAGETKTWAFKYQPGANLPKGAKLKFDLVSKGRELDWQIPQAGSKAKENAIWMVLPDGKTIYSKQIKLEKGISSQFEFTLPAEVQAGQELAIYTGSPDPKESKTKGTKAQEIVQRRRNFYLQIDPKGKGDYRETEAFNLDVKGNVLHSIRVITPSIVSKNERFDIVVRFEDAYGNLTGNAPEGTLIELSYDQLRDNINWKLFVPETGFINLPNLYFNEVGIYRIMLDNLSTKESFASSPIKCFADAKNHLFWGAFRGETEKYDSKANIEACLRHVRDEQAWQFFASSPFESEEETPSETWKDVSNQIAEFNEEDRFVTFLGEQYAGEPGEEGLRQLIYLKDSKPIFRKDDSKSNSLKKIYKSHTPKDLIAIPTFTMGKGVEFNFNDFTPEYEKVVEIYNAWGSSECTVKEGNLRPITTSSRKGYTPSPHGSIRRALNEGHRFGFVAGCVDERGVFSHLEDIDQTVYSPGLTGVLAATQTRDGFVQALSNKSCFATTGPRMLPGLYIAEQPMGSELSTKSKPGLSYNRHISGFAIGTEEIIEVSIFRNGELFKKFEPNTIDFEFAIDDSDPIQKNLLKNKGDNPPFLYYYMRIVQKDSNIAWSSPIWVDYIETESTSKKKKKSK